MREDWKYLPLGEICEFISGFTPQKHELNEKEGVPYYKVSDMNRNANSLYMEETELFVAHPRKTIPANSIIFPKNGGAIFTGKKRILKYDSIIDLNTEAINIKDKNIDLQFLYSFLLGIDFGQFDNGGGLPSINIRKMKEFIVPVPPLSEQERIVSLLDEQFAKIDALKANAASQLKATKDLFQSALKQLLTPQEGWERKMLKEVSTIIGGSTPKTNDASNWEGNNNWVTPAELNGEKYYGKTKRTISDKAARGMQLLPVGTVLLSSRAPIGKVAITTEPMYCNQGFKNIVCSNVLYNEYVYWYILFSVPLLEALGVGATFKELSKSKTEEFSISFPSLPEQERIAARLDEISEKVKALQANYDQTITLCNDLKQSLLKSIFA